MQPMTTPPRRHHSATVAVLCVALTPGAACLPPPDVSQWPTTGDGDGVVVLIHGAGEGEDTGVWADGMGADIQQAIDAIDDDRVWHVLAWDWYARSRSRELAPGAATDEGRAIADVVLAGQATHVHFVAHSTGVGVVQSALQTMADADANNANDVTVTTHATLLDPFALFGDTDCSQATFCDLWFNDDDGAPGSDEAIKSAFNINITETRPDAEDDRGHWWPTIAYGDSVLRGSVPGFGMAVEAGGDVVGLHGLYPRGRER